MTTKSRFVRMTAVLVVLLGASASVFAQSAAPAAAPAVTGLGLALGILGAAIATFLGGCGSAWGLGVAGQAAAGALSEDPNKFGVIFPIQALAGTQGIYGLLVGFLILTKIGVLGGDASLMTMEKGLYAVVVGLPAGVAGLISGFWQGSASAASIQLVSRKPGEFGKAIIGPALIETYAVFGLLMSFMMWLKL